MMNLGDSLEEAVAWMSWAPGLGLPGTFDNLLKRCIAQTWRWNYWCTAQFG